jgi:glutathione S-transferase
MITVHHLNNSRSQRILWMLEELGVPYEVKRYQRKPSMQAPDELRKVHPLGKSPVITDGDKVLAESGAILEYLSETYGGGRFTPAPGTPERLNYTYFMHYAEGSLMPPLLMKLVFGLLPARVPFFMRPVARALSGGASTVEVEGSTLAEVLKNLNVAHPGFADRLFVEAGNLHKFVNVFVSDDDVRYLDGLNTAVPAGETVSIIPAVAGG